jgi:hypothetical protein
MSSLPPPPPPGPPPAQASPFSPAWALSEVPPPFTATGTTKEDAIFEFRDARVSAGPGSLPLRAVVARFLGTPSQQKTYPADRLWMVLGRLRGLLRAVTQYNAGVASASAGPPSAIFTQYWRQRTLDQLSSFGYAIAHANQPVVVDGLAELVTAVEHVFADEVREARATIAAGQVVFEALAEVYRPDVPVRGVTSSLGGTSAAFHVVESYYEERRSLMGMEKSFHWTMEFVVTVGAHFTLARFTEVLSGWTGVRARPLSELTYVPVTDAAECAALKARGAHYVALADAGKPQFLAYGAHAFFLHAGGGGGSSDRAALAGTRGSNLLTKPGRVMVDPARGALLGHHAAQGSDEPTQAMINLAGRYRRWCTANQQQGAGGSAGGDALVLWETVPDELQVYCWPALVGFSFSAKAWGHVLVTGLTPIAFHDRAFDQLVLAEERKQLIRALVRFGSDDDTDDIVGGKRGGSVFLLHGPPGVGKTLTAEAIAEVLHRPLYYVTMGELGLTPDDMERRLSEVLELCAGWNALALLDEADVFLEQRAASDIVRNAMVCVMLRLLEYHPGILFLTTNRVRTFDPAFESRVTVALRYEALTAAARTQIWRNLLGRVSGVAVDAHIEFDALGTGHTLNGRQIKNAVRLAVALARERGTPLTQAVLDTTLQVTNIGREEMRNDDSWKEPAGPGAA